MQDDRAPVTSNLGGAMRDPSRSGPREQAALRDRDRIQETSDGRHHMLSLLVRRRAFPGTSEECERLVSSFEALLLPGWVERGLPLVDLSYGLAHPGVTPFGTVLSLQERDQGAAMVAALGGEAVVVILTDDPWRVAVPIKSSTFS